MSRAKTSGSGPRPFTARYAIVGEPTSLQPMRAGKVIVSPRSPCCGRERTCAYPQLGASAIFRAARFDEKIEQIAEELS
jgi:acetylornithine deacetylase